MFNKKKDAKAEPTAVEKVQKKQKLKSNAQQRAIFWLVLAGVIIMAVIGLKLWYSMQNQSVEVATVKAAGDRLPGKTPISPDVVEKGYVSSKDFKQGMIKWDTLQKKPEAYTSRFTDIPLRDGAILFEDDLTGEKLVPGEWLENITDGTVALTVPYDYLTAGGKLLIPGDSINYQIGMEDAGTGQYISPFMLEGLVVKDMLNGDGESIYDKYREVAMQDETTKEQLQKSQDFRKYITPKSLMLAVTKQQAFEYGKYNFQGKVKTTITINKRTARTADQEILYSTISQFLNQEQTDTAGGN